MIIAYQSWIFAAFLPSKSTAESYRVANLVIRCRRSLLDVPVVVVGFDGVVDWNDARVSWHDNEIDHQARNI